MEGASNSDNNNNNHKRKHGDDSVNNVDIKEEWEKLKNEREQFEIEKVQFEKEKRALEQSGQKVQRFDLYEPIELNIGGYKFSTTLDTLTKHRDSFFGSMFGGYMALKPNKDGSFFIDRDGTHFHYILSYLRTNELVIPENEPTPNLTKILLLEAEFYQISPLIDELRRNIKVNEPLFDSAILPQHKPEFCDQLNEWVGCPPTQKWKLLYRGSRDTFNGSVFHEKCDHQGASYTIVRSDDNIFGGYNPHSWTSNDDFSNGPNSFLFSLVNPFGMAPFKLQSIKNYGGYNRANFLPSFGHSYNFSLSTDCNLNNRSESKINDSYENTTDQKYPFTGAKHFTVDGLEVFVKV
eukprot:TRINITY_DN3095_c0_g2_i1.p1 TRINITY_DN3095_c0_g2~~TRINITY_DN3095_c0_g2_i1.p1  ORF type:complete len:394 (-),score=71.28 TRINITY_DN3095_c0_g2_i1:126-1175(-)